MKLIRRITAAAATTIAALLSPAHAASAQAKSEIVIALGAQPPGLDSHINTVGVTNELTRNIFEGLVTMDSRLEVKPALAESWSVSEDGKTYVFQLRKGVKFHNGAPLTAKDVVASMERWSRLSNPGKLTFSKAVWTAEGDAKVVLKMPAATYKVLFTLGNAFNQPPSVMPASIALANPDKPVREFIGTGPYKLREWVADQHLILERFADYTAFPGAADGWAGNRTPEIDTLRFTFISDDATRVLGLQTAQFDVVPNVPPDSVQQLMDDKNIKVESYAHLALFLITNKATGLFKDVKARKAVDVALDREEILYAAASSEKLFSRNHHLMFDDQDAIWKTDIGRKEYGTRDINQGKKLLKEAGYDGRELVMITSRDYSDIYNAAVMIQQQLTSIGIKVRLDSYDWPTFIAMRAKKEGWDLLVINNTYKVDPTHWLHLAKNYAGFTDSPELDAILAEFETAKDLKEAHTAYERLMTWHLQYLPASILGDELASVAFGPKISQLPVMGGPVYWRARLSK